MQIFLKKGNSVAGEGLDEDLHTLAKVNVEVEGQFFLNIVIGKSVAIFELLSAKSSTAGQEECPPCPEPWP